MITWPLCALILGSLSVLALWDICRRWAISDGVAAKVEELLAKQRSETERLLARQQDDIDKRMADHGESVDLMRRNAEQHIGNALGKIAQIEQMTGIRAGMPRSA